MTLSLLVLLTLLGATSAWAQPSGRVYQVGLVSAAPDPRTWREQYKPFIEAMNELGYVEGRTARLAAQRAGRPTGTGRPKKDQ